MENKEKDKVVFYGPLPVNKPYPIIRPNDKIQLQPTVNPVAITPYVNIEDDTVAESAFDEDVVVKKREKRFSARIGGLLMLIVGVLSILMFAFAFSEKYPIEGTEQYSITYFGEAIKNLFNGSFVFQTSFVPLLIVVAFALICANTLLSLIAILAGRRFGYAWLAFCAFVLLVIAAFYEIKFFSDIKNIGSLLSRAEGWPSIILMIIGGANLVIACFAGIICPKHHIVKTVEF